MKNYADFLAEKLESNPEMFTDIEIYEMQILIGQLMNIAVHDYKIPRLQLMHLLKLSPVSFYRIMHGDIRMDLKKTYMTLSMLYLIISFMKDRKEIRDISNETLLDESRKLCMPC